jgi:hypothetical protein
MVTPTCSKCRRVIARDDVNVAKDVAYCRDCNTAYRLSELTSEEGPAPNFDLRHPPKGTWFVNDRGVIIIGATNRNLVSAVGFTIFALFWNGILSIFVLLAIAATLHQLHVPLPEWFPDPKMNDEEMTVGMTIFLWIFLTPFIIVGLFMTGVALSSIFGRTEVRISHSQASVFTGIGGLGWKRRFDPSRVQAVRIDRKHHSEGSDTFTILAETREGKQIKFGSLLSQERRQFMLAALRQTVLQSATSGKAGGLKL